MSYDYDLVVIGGGSGGLACAKQAAELGARVAIFDFVKPTVHGTKWDIGGTCVNVGCIPKKLMHYTALLGAGFHDAAELGWEMKEQPKHDWKKMVGTVNNYIRSLNFGYRVELRTKNIEFINQLAKFLGPNKLGYTDKQGQSHEVTAKNIVIAVGGRPYIPEDLPGRELAITSDDIFWQQKPPGKTCLVGASYISLETAGFLREMGYNVTVLVRSILLRGFDRECAESIGTYMKQVGVRFVYKVVPTSLTKEADGRIKVTYRNRETGEEASDVFDTVLYATGRRADTAGLNLAAAGVQTAANGKFAVQNEQTNVQHIYAIGDVVEGRQELTPVAIQAGALLAKRLFSGATLQMDYTNVPTTVFTPIEYGAIGYSEEEAEQKYGKGNIEVFVSQFSALEQAASHRVDNIGLPIENPCMSKLIVNPADGNRVVGFHYLGPNAGEVTQGYALAIKLGATKADFDNVVGIHPTTAESFTTLSVTKSSGEDAAAGGC